MRDVRNIDQERLASFASELRESITPRGAPLSAMSQAIYLQRVKSFLSSLARRGLLLRDPAADLSLPVSSPLPRTVLSVRQAERLVEAPPAHTKVGRRDRAILETLYGTAIRRGECVRLDLEDLDLREQTLLVRDGKGHKDRLVPVPGRAAAALGTYVTNVRPHLAADPRNRALFLTAWWGHRLAEITLAVLVRRWARAAGLVGVHPHALRHTCATHLLRGGADVRHVQVILGHKRLKTTGLYTRVAIEDLRQVLERAHPRDRAGGK